LSGLIDLIAPAIEIARRGRGVSEEGHYRQSELLDGPACGCPQAARRPCENHAGVVATYESVPGAGKDVMDELSGQTRAVFMASEIENTRFPKRIAFNLIPQIDVFMEDGFTKEEWKMVVETKKILDPKIKLVAGCVNKQDPKKITIRPPAASALPSPRPAKNSKSP
jgi:hypothetical protein